MKNCLLLLTFNLLSTFCAGQTKYYSFDQISAYNIEDFSKMKSLKIEMLKKKFPKMAVLESYYEIKRNADSIIDNVSFKIMPRSQAKNILKRNKFVGKQFPFENSNTIDGSNISTFIDNGKPTLVNLWFTQCPPCIEEIPILNKIQDEYKDRINFVAITFDEKFKVLQFFSKVFFDFEHITDALKITAKLKIQSYPVNYLIDKNKNIYSTENGIEYARSDGGQITIGSGDELRRRLDQLLIYNSNL